MTRGHPPVVAIAEAMHYAERIGYLVSGVNSRTLPCNFMAIHDGQITLVRVRRIRYAHYGLPDIAVSCKREILELRGIPVSDDTSRELWVRGPDRHWHRYVIFPDRIEVSDGDIFGVRASQQPGAADASGRVIKEGGSKPPSDHVSHPSKYCCKKTGNVCYCPSLW